MSDRIDWKNHFIELLVVIVGSTAAYEAALQKCRTLLTNLHKQNR